MCVFGFVLMGHLGKTEIYTNTVNSRCVVGYICFIAADLIKVTEEEADGDPVAPPTA